MARKISTLKQLRTALRSITLSEFMQLSRGGRVAYGALFDEMEEMFVEPEEAEPQLPAPDEHRRLPSSPPVVTFSGYPAAGRSMAPPDEPFRRLQPLPGDQPVAPWAATLSMLGVDLRTAEDSLQGQRELWARGQALRTLREAGLAFDDAHPDPARQPNLGHDLHVV